MTLTATPPRNSFQAWCVIVAIGVLFFLTNTDYTAVNLTLVPIAEELGGDLAELQWLISGYVLVWAAFVIPAGRIADIYGKRPTLIWGLLAFMAGSWITGFFHSLPLLIGGRLLQGLGAAIFTAPAWACIFTSAPPKKQGLAMGVVTSFAGFGLAAGPTLGGFMIEEWNWRWIFYINIPLSLLVITILLLFAPKEDTSKNTHKIDFRGAALLASGVCLSIYAISQIETLGITSHLFLSLLGGGLLLIGTYWWLDQKQAIRMIPPYLFRNKPYMAATLGEFFMAMNFSMIIVLMGLYLQNTLNYSSYETGLVFIAMTITMGLLSLIGGKMIDVCGIKAPMVFGGLMTFVATTLMIYLTTDSSLFYVCTCLFFAGIGMGTFFPASNTAMMHPVPPDDLNVASGVYTMFMMVGNTISVILATMLVVFFGKAKLLENTQTMMLSPTQHQDLVDIISQVEHSASQLTDFPSDQVPQLLTWVNEAFVYGLSLDMIMGSCFALCTTGLAIWGIKGNK